MPAQDHSAKLILFNTLLSLYEHKGLEVYKTLDYYECRELIDIAGSARENPEDKLQHIENTRFNKYLDKVSYNKFKWMYIDTKHNLWSIKDISSDTSQI